MDAIVAAISKLPQQQHLSPEQVTRFVEQLRRLDKSPAFYIERLKGFGGTEVGALLRHAVPQFAEAPGACFKNAYQIVMEKLMRAVPLLPTPQARRGSLLEPLIRDVFVGTMPGIERYNHAFEVTRTHATHSCLRGEIDDAFTTSRYKFVVDYKSSQEQFDALPFDYDCQIHTYAAIAASNGCKFDRGLVVGLHAPEPVLEALARVAEQRHEKPEHYSNWVKVLTDHDAGGIQIQRYPVHIAEKKCQVIEKIVPEFWSRFVMKGELLPFAEPSREMPQELHDKLTRILEKSGEVIAAHVATDSIKSKLNDEMRSLLLGFDPTDSFKDLHTTVYGKSEFDMDSAIAALDADGVCLERYTEIAKQYDREKLLRKIDELGGEINESELKSRVPVKKLVVRELQRAGIDPRAFERKSHYIGQSRRSVHSELIKKNQIHWEQSITEAVDHLSLYSSVDTDDRLAANSSQASMLAN